MIQPRRAVLAFAAVLWAAATLTFAAPPMNTQPPRRAPALDGGELVFDGQFYDYRDPQSKKAVTLWVPPGTAPVRGVLFHGNPGSNGDTRSTPRDPALQQFAARFGFGVAGVTWIPGGAARGDAGKAVFDALTGWSKLGPHPELAHVPLIVRGSSNAGMTAYGLTCLAPSRIICLTPNVGPRYGTEPPPADALNVPGWLHIGPADPFFPLGLKDTAELFMQHQPPLWAWDAEQGKAHELGHVDDVDMAFYETCIRLRLPPPDPAARAAPVKLTPIARDSGWLADTTTWAPGRGPGIRAVTIAPAASYSGDRARAVWLPDAETAMLYRAIATYNVSVKLRVDGLAPVDNPLATGTLLRSVGGRVIEPGARLRIVADIPRDVTWQSVEFFSAGKSIGVATAPADPAIDVSADGTRAVNAFCALVTRADGSIVATRPTHVLVSDPAILAALAPGQKAAADDTVPGFDPAAVVPPGSTRAAASPAADHTLAATPLTPEQESAFAAATGPAAFWESVATVAELNPARHTAGDNKFPAGSTLTVRVKAAQSRRGIYLLFTATGPVAKPADESVDFHIAAISSVDLFAPGPDRAARFSSAQYALATSGQQYQAPFVGDTVRRTYPSPFTMFVPRASTTAEAAALHGIVIRRHTLPGGARAIEWLIPWSQVGRPGSLTAEPPAGTRLGLVLGYNGDGQLRWPTGGDPWQTPYDAPKASDCWGDLATAR